MGDLIEVGDRVDVSFENSRGIFNAEVLNIPQATGDSWKLKLPGGYICYVQLFSRMDKRP